MSRVNKRAPRAGVALTTTHVASNEAERELIIARGGEVPECAKGECPRVNGLIEVTRSLGDKSLKPVLDSTPAVLKHKICEEDAFIVMGTDGLFDFVDDATVVRSPSTPF